MSAQTAFAAALLDPELPPPDGLVAWNGSDPARRFAVYRNNVVVSLVDALADTFAVTQELVGEAFFRAMARVFALADPPKSRLMAFYGESFPNFIAGFPPVLAFLTWPTWRGWNTCECRRITRETWRRLRRTNSLLR